MPSEPTPFCSKLSVVNRAMQSHNYRILLADSFVGRRHCPQPYIAAQWFLGSGRSSKLGLRDDGS
jgi:hypothetical protein